MKFFICCVFIFSGFVKLNAQKYILLDKQMSQPAFYADELSITQKYNGFYPVKVRDIEKFLAVLREISQTLSSENITGKAKQYQVGCDEFEGHIVHLASGNRLNYVLTSNCDNMNVTMHLCDAKLSNENNAYFINTWISYIKSSVSKNR